MSSPGIRVVTQLVVDASGAKTGTDEYVAALERARAAQEGTEGGVRSFDATLKRWQKSLGDTDPVIRAQIRMQQELQRQTDLNTRAVQLGIVTQDAASAQLDRVRAKYQGYVNDAEAAAESSTVFGKGLGFIVAQAGPLVGLLSAASIIGFAKSTFEGAAALNEQAEQVGVNVEAFQAYLAVMKENGIANDNAAQLIGKLTQNIGNARAQAGPARDALNELNIGYRDLAGGVEQALPKIAAALLQIPDVTERARLEADLFGKTGQKLETALRALIDPTSTLVEKERALGLVMGRDVTTGADKAGDRLDALMQQIRTQHAPLVVWFTGLLADMAEAMAKPPTLLGYDPLDVAGQQRQRQQQSADLSAFHERMAQVPQVPWAWEQPAANDNVAANNKNYPTTELDQYIAKQRLSASIAAQGPVAQAALNAQIEAANIKLAAGAGLSSDVLDHFKNSDGTARKFVQTADEAVMVLGKATAQQVAGLGAAIAQGQQWQKLRETFRGYLGDMAEQTRVAGETAAQREVELDTIKGAQVYQKERGATEKELVKTYADALAVLGPIRAAEIARADSARVTAALEKQITDQLTLAGVAAHNNRDTRELALEIAQKELEIGRALTEQEKQRLALVQQRTDTARLRDFTDQLKDEVSLAGLSADERERQQAVLQAMQITHGKLTEDQQREIQGLVAARQETERWRGVVDGIASGFQNFFENILVKARANFGDLWNSIKAQFAQLLAWMASQALVQPIIIPMVEEVLGGQGSLYSLLGGNSNIAGGGNALGTLGTVANASSLLNLGGGGIFGSLGGGISSAFNSLGSALGFSSQVQIGTNLIGEPMFATMPGSVFGTSLGGFLGGAGLGSLAGSLIFGNKNDAGLGSMGGGALGAAIGSVIPGVGTILGGLLGGVLGGGLGSLTGSSNQGAIANFSNGGLSNYLFKQGGGNNGALSTQAANTISDAIKTLQDAGVTLSLGNITGLSIGSDKSYVYDSAGGKQKLGGGDVEGVVKAILNRILPSISGNTPEAQAVLAKYQAQGGINASNLSQLESDLGAAKNFADALANLKSSGDQLSQIAQQLAQINTQYDQLVTQAQQLGLDTSSLTEARDDAVQAMADNFESSVEDALNGILNGPLQQWNALVKAQAQQISDAKALGVDLVNVEQLQYLQRKALLMSLDDAQRTSLLGLIGLADDLAAKTITLQAAALTAVNSQIAASQKFADQQAQLAGQYGSASQSIDSARIGFLVDPNANRLSPADAYAQSRAQLDAAARAAQGGDLNSLNSLGGLAQSFLNNSLAVNASSQAYAGDFAYVQQLLSGAKAQADAQQSAALTQSQLAGQQVDILNKIATELQKPDPSPDLLKQMLDQLGAINIGIGSNAQAIIATFQADPTAHAIDTLGAIFRDGSIAQTASVTNALDTLRAATADGLLTVAEADPVRAALGVLQDAVSARLADQSHLTSDQLSAALQGQALLDQIRASLGTGVDVLNLKSVSDPINSLVYLTAATAQPAQQVVVQNTITNVTNVNGTTADTSTTTGQSAADTQWYNAEYIKFVQQQAQQGDGDPAISNSWKDLARSLGINAYASGIDYAPGGWSLVGEEGPELVRLPRGAAVMPNNQLRNWPTNDNSALVEEIRALRAQVAELQKWSGQTARNTAKGAGHAEETVGRLDKLDGNVRRAGIKSLMNKTTP